MIYKSNTMFLHEECMEMKSIITFQCTTIVSRLDNGMKLLKNFPSKRHDPSLFIDIIILGTPCVCITHIVKRETTTTKIVIIFFLYLGPVIIDDHHNEI